MWLALFSINIAMEIRRRMRKEKRWSEIQRHIYRRLFFSGVVIIFGIDAWVCTLHGDQRKAFTLPTKQNINHFHCFNDTFVFTRDFIIANTRAFEMFVRVQGLTWISTFTQSSKILLWSNWFQVGIFWKSKFRRTEMILSRK